MNQYPERQESLQAGIGGTRLCIGKRFWPPPSPSSMQEETKVYGQVYAPASLPAGKVPSLSIGCSKFG